MTDVGDGWVDKELADERLTNRLRKIVERTENAMGDSIPLAWDYPEFLCSGVVTAL